MYRGAPRAHAVFPLVAVMDATPDQQAWELFAAGFAGYAVLYVMTLVLRLSVDFFRVLFGRKDAVRTRRKIDSE